METIQISNKEIYHYLNNISESAKEQIINTLLMDNTNQSKEYIIERIEEYNQQYPKDY